VLLGTRCSLEFALDNPTSTCNTLGVDPHVHPLYIYAVSLVLQPLQLLYNKTSPVPWRVKFEFRRPPTVPM
jgi:hypothetical protein